MKPNLTTSAHRVFCWMKTSFYLDIDNELTKNSYESCFIIGSHEAWNSTQLKNISRLTHIETVFALKSFKIRFWLFFCNPYQNILQKNWCRNHWQIPTPLSNSWNWHFNYFYGSCKIDDTNPFHIKTKCSFFISTSSKYQMYSNVSSVVEF